MIGLFLIIRSRASHRLETFSDEKIMDCKTFQLDQEIQAEGFISQESAAKI